MSLIAIVDDRATNRSILAKLATSLGRDVLVRTFEDPRAALDWAAENEPDLVITDFKMPGMDGADFVAELRRRPSCADTPVVVVTVYEDREFRYRALEAGATDFLLSPLDHHEFRTRVRNLLTMKKQQEIIKRRALTLEETLATANRLRLEEVSDNRETLGRVVDSVPVMICVTDREGTCVLANRSLCEFFGVEPETVIGKAALASFGPAFAGCHQELEEQVFATGNRLSGMEMRLPDRSGLERIFETTKAPLFDAFERVRNVVTVAIDVTDRILIEQALLKAKQEAEAANQTKSEFLANTSHELRTPLNAILGFSEIMATSLLGDIQNERYKEYIEDIWASANHLLRIINDVLDLSVIEAGKLVLQEEELDLRQAVDDIFRLVRKRASDAQVQVTYDVPEWLPRLYADERKLKQILLNLIYNAIKFTPPGGNVLLQAATAADNGVRIVVADTGIGIGKQDLPTALSRFGRIQRTGTQTRAGTGLGLPLAVELVKLHGGTFDITSEIGEGTTITIGLPPGRSRLGLERLAAASRPAEPETVAELRELRSPR